MERKMYDIREAAEFLGCSVSKLRQMKREGSGPSVFQCGGLVRYTEAALEKFVEEHSTAPQKG